MIEVNSLSKRFDETQALNSLSMTVPDGAVYGLVGPNGAGKSTLIRHLVGIYRQDSGEIRVDGEPVFTFSHDRDGSGNPFTQRIRKKGKAKLSDGWSDVTFSNGFNGYVLTKYLKKASPCTRRGRKNR